MQRLVALLALRGRCDRRQVARSLFPGRPDDAAAARLRPHGIHCLAVATDLGVVTEGCRSLLAEDGVTP